MPKKNTLPSESQNDACPENSENILENVKYIKKLKLQRSVLNKLVASELNQSAGDEGDDPAKTVNTKITKKRQ